MTEAQDFETPNHYPPFTVFLLIYSREGLCHLHLPLSLTLTSTWPDGLGISIPLQQVTQQVSAVVVNHKDIPGHREVRI